MQIIKNVLLQEEIDVVLEENKKFFWELEGSSQDQIIPKFWFKNLVRSKNKKFFENKISQCVKKNIVVDRIYCNGQALGQCGFWHRDVEEESENKFTLVYFYQQWLPEFGGHFMININEEIFSILPEYNKAVLFKSNYLHMALGASRHCPIQRESLAVKFTVF
jgi:hypothetical protein